MANEISKSNILAASIAIAAFAPQNAISSSSKSHVMNVFAQLKEGILVAQMSDYDEFFLDQPSGPFSEDQWFEITPEFADMFPEPLPLPETSDMLIDSQNMGLNKKPETLRMEPIDTIFLRYKAP